MKFEHVCLEAFAYVLPDEVVTSEQIEEQLRTVYEKLSLPAGRLELMTGIRERRFFPRGTRPGEISAQTVQKVIDASQIPIERFGALIHGSVCRDQLEPATASGVHQKAGLPSNCMMLDVSNACLGLLNGILIIAVMIELGQIQAGVVVGTEDGRGLVEGTIHSLVNDPSITRQSIKSDIASLTIGSASAAVVVCHSRLSRTGNRLLGASCLADSSHNELCEGGVAAQQFGDDRPRMQTDSEALLHAGIGLATENWIGARQILGWENSDVDKAFTHQVGKAHTKLLYENLGLNPELDFASVEYLGNTGAAALPVTTAIGLEQGHVQPGDNVALLGIGSGLNSIMMGCRFEQNSA